MQYVYFFSSAILLQTKIAFYLAHELEINIYHGDRLLIYIDNLYDKKDNSLREFISDANDVFDKIKFEAINKHSVLHLQICSENSIEVPRVPDVRSPLEDTLQILFPNTDLSEAPQSINLSITSPV